MPNVDPDNLAEAQRETVRALAILTEQLRGVGDNAIAGRDPAPSARGDGETGRQRDGETMGRVEAAKSQSTETLAQVMRDLALITTANTQAVTGLSRGLEGLPELLAGLVGGVKSGGGVLGSVLTSGFGLASLGLKIAGLFGGGNPAEPAPLLRFLSPLALALEVANTDDILAGFPGVSRGQQGEARAVERQSTVVMQPQVTVNVSAMDSQSFLDRSEDIARAVREAMLHMHPVNDVISEL